MPRLQFEGGTVEGAAPNLRAAGDVTLYGLVLGYVSPFPLAVGFVWSATALAPTLRDNDGVTPAQYVLCTSPTGRTSFSAVVSAAELPPGLYYMRAYARWPPGRGTAVYSTVDDTFNVPEAVTVTMLSVEPNPPLVLMRGQYDQNPAFNETGFVWALTREDLTRERCVGSFIDTADAAIFSNNLDTSGLLPGLYYVTAFALSNVPEQPIVTVYAPDPLQFEVTPPPEGEVAMEVIVDAYPWVALFGVFEGSTTIFTQVGFVWATTPEDLTLEAATGSIALPSVTGQFTDNLDTTDLSAGLYYVTAFAQSAAVTLYGSVPEQFYAGVQTPTVYTEHAYQEVYGEGAIAVHLRMVLTNTQPTFVSNTALYAFECSATNPEPSAGDTIVSATRVGNATAINVVIENADPEGIKYVRAAAGLGALNSPADNVLTVQRAPYLGIAVVSQIETRVTFLGTATYDVFPSDEFLARVQVQTFGYVWAKDRTPSLDEYDGVGVTLPTPPPGSQPPTFVPEFPQHAFTFDGGAGVYNTRAFVTFLASSGASDPQAVYSRTYDITL